MSQTLATARAEAERACILDALHECAGNAVHAATALGISHRALLYLLTRHQLAEQLAGIRERSRSARNLAIAAKFVAHLEAGAALGDGRKQAPTSAKDIAHQTKRRTRRAAAQ